MLLRCQRWVVVTLYARAIRWYALLQLHYFNVLEGMNQAGQGEVFRKDKNNKEAQGTC